MKKKKKLSKMQDMIRKAVRKNMAAFIEEKDGLKALAKRIRRMK